jgi:uncharacterized protein (TIGR03435 family)
VKVQVTKDTSAPVIFRVYQRHQITAANAPILHLIEALSWLLGRSAVDETGLPGVYDYELEWSPDDFQPASEESHAASESPLPSLNAELQEKMGLRLTLQHGPVEIVVSDRAEKRTVN